MATCSPITADIAFSCSAPQEGGIKSRVIIVNYEDWKAATVTTDGSTNEITGITLAAGGKEGFEVAVPLSSNIVATSPSRGNEGVPTYNHIVQLTINSISQADTEQMEDARLGKVVIIVELIEGRSYVYGGWADATPEPRGIGMRCTETGENNPGDPALGGSKTYTFSTPENDPGELHQPHLIASSFDIDGLLTPTA